MVMTDTEETGSPKSEGGRNVQLRSRNCQYFNLAGTCLPVKADRVKAELLASKSLAVRTREDFDQMRSAQLVIFVTRSCEVSHGGSRASLQI
jgi:hypothetical protein